ncbi:MAG: serine O-acetyltransferase [Eubacterium sp.]|nr:serine O-acetyltransferase [Eubacterium sp.]
MRFSDYYKEQVKVIRERDPSIHSDREALTYPFFWAMWAYQKAHAEYKKGNYYKARKISQKAARKTGIEIHPGAVIGEGFFIDHGHGVVIGETAVIGNNVTLYQGVTLGGTGKEQGKRHPTLEDNVMVSAGAKVLGSITVGRNSKIGAGSVVIRDVPPNSTVVGIPGRVAKQDDVHIPRLDLNQVDLPDPIINMIELLKDENETLKQTLKILEEKRELDHQQIEKNKVAVSQLEDRFLFSEGAGI